METLFDAAIALGFSLDMRDPITPKHGGKDRVLHQLFKERRLLATTTIKFISSIVKATAPGGDTEEMLISNLPEFWKIHYLSLCFFHRLK